MTEVCGTGATVAVAVIASIGTLLGLSWVLYVLNRR